MALRFIQPLPFTLKEICCIKNRKEASLLLEINEIISELEIALNLLVTTLKEIEFVDEVKQRILINIEDASLSALIPITHQTNDLHNQMLQKTVSEISSKLTRLSKMRGHLTQYVEMNKSLHQELIQENCQNLANEKLRLSEMEEQILNYVNTLLVNNNSLVQ